MTPTFNNKNTLGITAKNKSILLIFFSNKKYRL